MRTPLLSRSTTTLAISAMLVVAAAGCASTTPHTATARDHTEVWLSEAPRRLVVRATEAQKDPTLWVYDFRTEQRVGEAMKGAGAGAGISVMAGCMGLPVLGCVLGVFFIPVGMTFGAVVGAASVDSQEVAWPISEAKGLPELHRTQVREAQLGERLAQALLAAAPEAGPHQLSVPTGESVEGELLADVRVDFYGQRGEDPRIGLRVFVRPAVRGGERESHSWGELAYQSATRPLADWAADEGALFRGALDEALRVLAADVAKQLSAPPQTGAAMRVAAAQEAERMRGEQEKRDEQHRRQVEQARAREAAAPAKAAAPAPARFPRPGTSWIYRYEDRLYGRRTHRFGVHVDSISAQSVTDVLKDDGGQPTSGSFDPAEVRFAPRPIASGRTIYELAPYLDSSSPPPVSSWQQIAGTISGVPVDAWQFRVLSIAREMVTVPAGTFDALRVEIEGQRRADVAELTQGVRFTMDVQRFRYVAWYASDVRRYVMSHLREWPALGRPQTTDEVVQLVEYRLSTN